MAWSAVLKNIYTFGKVLSQAGTDAVTQWDEQSLRNAFQWAKYCQKIAEQTLKKPYRAELDGQLKSMTVLLDPASLLQLNLDKLTRAPALLIETLLLNPASPNHVLAMVVDAGTQDQHEFVKVCSNIFLRIKEEEAVQKITAVLGGEKLEIEVSVRAQTNLILDCLHTCQSCSTSQSQNYLENLLRRVTSHTMGWDIVLQLILTCSSMRDGDDAWKDDIVKPVTRWVINNSSFKSGLWHAEAETLCAVASSLPEFRDIYLDHLVTWCKNMEPVYGITATGDLYSWRLGKCGEENMDPSEEPTFSFSVLQAHVSAMLRKGGNSGSCLHATLTDLGNASSFNVWKELLKTAESGVT